MKRKLALDCDQLKRLTTDRGGCIATDMITVEGKKVGYMARDTPIDHVDSGWQFLSGKESRAYISNKDNSAVYDVNTIANYDPDIVPYLDAPFGSSFERRGKKGRFVQVTGKPWKPRDPAQKGWPPLGYPLVKGEHELTPTWTIHLPQLFARRIEDGSLVLWRPGLTVWLCAWRNDRGESQAERLANFKKSASETRFAEREVVADGITRFDYRTRGKSGDAEVESLNAFIFSDDGYLQAGIYFDDPADETTARRLVDSVVARRAPKS
jgi:hypothetical protein